MNQSEHTDFEALLQQKFADAAEQPSDGVWQVIEQSLDFEKNWQNKLSDAAEQPPARVWLAIEHSLDFEKNWQNKLSDATEQPSGRVWEGIEQFLSSDVALEKQLQASFAVASELPDARVWDKIEQSLDDDDDDIVPLFWWQSPRTWLAAAGLVLVLSAAWLSLPDHKPQELARDSSKAPKRSAVESSSSRKGVPQSINSQANSANSPIAGVTSTFARVYKPNKSSSPKAKVYEQATNYDQQSTVNLLVGNQRQSPVSPTVGQTQVVEKSLNINENTPLTHQNGDITSPEPTTVGSAQPQLVLNEMGLKGLTLSHLAANEPHVKSQIVDAIKRKQPLYFMEVGLMPAQFNSGLDIADAKNSVVASNQIGFSTSVYARVGKYFGKRFSVETGVGLLDAHSSYKDAKAYVTALEKSLDNMPHSTARKSVSGVKSIIAPLVQTVSSALPVFSTPVSVENHVKLIQIPVQLSYALVQSPDGMVGVSVLGGVVGNLFQENQVGTLQNPIYVLDQNSEMYRSLSVSATGGLRLRYRLNKHLSGSLTGQYQKSLRSATQAAASFGARPSLAGVEWGVRYNF